MKLIINIPEEKLNIIKNKMYCGIYDSDLYKTIANGISIPDNATNGKVIQTLFKPNRVERTDDDVIVENYDFSEEWWNAPYQKGGKE